jgi:uncharacterized damage-inducible protein DinB
MSSSSEISDLFITQSRDYLRGEFLPKIERAIAPLSTEQLWWRANDPSNSIGNLMLHLAGNVRQWIVCGVGGADDTRDRAKEFATREHLPAGVLIAELRRAVDDACAVLDRINLSTLSERRQIQRFDTTLLGGIYHVVEHFSMHTGQIIMLAKMQTGQDAGFYKLRADGTPEPTWTDGARAFEKSPGT